MHGRFAGEVVSDLKHRPEGVRIRHAYGLNSVKLYDKQGQVLRVETTDPRREWPEGVSAGGGRPGGRAEVAELRKGVADLHRRCELSQAANERYLEALAVVESPTPLGDLSGPLCHRMVKDGRRYRALNPLGEVDARLLEFVGRGGHLITGFRNRDVRHCLYGERSKDAAVHRRQLLENGLEIRVQRTKILEVSITPARKFRMLLHTNPTRQRGIAGSLAAHFDVALLWTGFITRPGIPWGNCYG